MDLWPQVAKMARRHQRRAILVEAAANGPALTSKLRIRRSRAFFDEPPPCVGCWPAECLVTWPEAPRAEPEPVEHFVPIRRDWREQAQSTSLLGAQG